MELKKNDLDTLSPEMKLLKLREFMDFWIDDYHAKIVEMKGNDEVIYYVHPTGSFFLPSFRQWYQSTHCPICGGYIGYGFIPQIQHPCNAGVVFYIPNQAYSTKDAH